VCVPTLPLTKIDMTTTEAVPSGPPSVRLAPRWPAIQPTPTTQTEETNSNDDNRTRDPRPRPGP
jgi:hypothetical protein